VIAVHLKAGFLEILASPVKRPIIIPKNTARRLTSRVTVAGINVIPLAHPHRIGWDNIILLHIRTADLHLHLVTLGGQRGDITSYLRPNFNVIFVIEILGYPVPAPGILYLQGGIVNSADNHRYHCKKENNGDMAPTPGSEIIGYRKAALCHCRYPLEAKR
jgi:hypothetical protein